MASGDSREGSARADRIREEMRSHGRYLQRVVDEERERGELPSYNDDSPSEITVNSKLGNMGAKLGLPRTARMVIGICIGVGLGSLLVAGAIVAVLRFLP